MGLLDKFKRKTTEAALLEALDKFVQPQQDKFDAYKLLSLHSSFKNAALAHNFAREYAPQYLPKIAELCQRDRTKIENSLSVAERVFCIKSAYKNEQQIEPFVTFFEDIAAGLSLSQWENVHGLTYEIVKGRYKDGLRVPSAINKDQYARLMTLHVKWDEQRLMQHDHFYLADWSCSYIGCEEDDDHVNPFLPHLSSDLSFQKQLLQTVSKLTNPTGSEAQFQYLCQAAKVLPETLAQPLLSKLGHAIQNFAANTLNVNGDAREIEPQLKNVIARVSYANALGLKLNLGDVDLLHTVLTQDERRAYDGGKIEFDVKCYNDIYLYKFNQVAQPKAAALCIFKSDSGFTEFEDHEFKPDFWAVSSPDKAQLILTDNVEKALVNEFGANGHKVSQGLSRAYLQRPIIK